MIRSSYDKSKLVQAFEKESTQKAINDTKTATIIGCILYPIYSVLDLFVYPNHYLEFLVIRATVVGACLSVFGLMHTKFGRTYPKVIGTLLYIVGCLSIVLMVHRVGGYESPYYAGVNLVLIIFLAILPMDLRRTLIICCVEICIVENTPCYYEIEEQEKHKRRDAAKYEMNNVLSFFYNEKQENKATDKY